MQNFENVAYGSAVSKIHRIKSLSWPELWIESTINAKHFHLFNFNYIYSWSN